MIPPSSIYALKQNSEATEHKADNTKHTEGPPSVKGSGTKARSTACAGRRSRSTTAATGAARTSVKARVYT